MRAAAMEPRNSAKPVRRWRYLHRVMRTKRKLKVLVYQLTELHPTRYTRDIRDRFELANTRELGTSPVVEFPGSYAVKPYGFTGVYTRVGLESIVQGRYARKGELNDADYCNFLNF